MFNRGKSDPGAFPQATHLVGHRDRDLTALSTGEWDATVDVSAYGHQQVRSLLEVLDGRGGHLTFISTISVYGQEVPESGFTEEAKLLPPEFDDSKGIEAYGEKKVACEQVAAEYVKDRLLILRPGYVIGPWDYSRRFEHWINAVVGGKPFDAPAAAQPLQTIDGRDLGSFTVGCIERGVTGPFNVTAPQEAPTFSEVLATIANALNVELPEVRWGDPNNESEELPLSAAQDWWPKMRADISKAIGEGLTWRPLEDSVRDTVSWAEL